MIQTKTEEQIQFFLDRITYKPGWVIEIVTAPVTQQRNEYDSIPIRVCFPVKDVLTGKDTTLSFIGAIAPSFITPITDDYIRYCIENLIRQAEDHEFQEWFKFDGVCVYNPHPELKEEKLNDSNRRYPGPLRQ